VVFLLFCYLLSFLSFLFRAILLSGAILYKFMNSLTIIAIMRMKIMAIIEMITVIMRLVYPRLIMVVIIPLQM